MPLDKDDVEMFAERIRTETDLKAEACQIWAVRVEGPTGFVSHLIYGSEMREVLHQHKRRSEERAT